MGVGNVDEMLLKLIPVLTATSAAILAWVARGRTIRRDAAADANKDATLRTDVDYIKRGVDDMRFEIRSQRQQYDALSERVTRVEESSKQAHYRLNRIEGNKNGS